MHTKITRSDGTFLSERKKKTIETWNHFLSQIFPWVHSKWISAFHWFMNMQILFWTIMIFNWMKTSLKRNKFKNSTVLISLTIFFSVQHTVWAIQTPFICYFLQSKIEWFYRLLRFDFENEQKDDERTKQREKEKRATEITHQQLDNVNFVHTLFDPRKSNRNEEYVWCAIPSTN